MFDSTHEGDVKGIRKCVVAELLKGEKSDRAYFLEVYSREPESQPIIVDGVSVALGGERVQWKGATPYDKATNKQAELLYVRIQRIEGNFADVAAGIISGESAFIEFKYALTKINGVWKITRAEESWIS